MLYEEVADKPPTRTQIVLAANNMIAGTWTTQMWRQNMQSSHIIEETRSA